MKITAVVENTSRRGLPTEHGLSLWVEACDRRFFFDLGQGRLFADNATVLGIDIATADFAIVSHGHYDHGGGIATFLDRNPHAPVFLNRSAFTDCYSMRDGRARYIGLSKDLIGNSRIRLIDATTTLAPGLTLFSQVDGRRFFSPANSRILMLTDGELQPDVFAHEQSLLVSENGRRVLLAGCAHAGIVNIIARAEEISGETVTDVVAGMHLAGVEDSAFIDGLANELAARDCQFHTCHCTGEEAFARMKTLMGRKLNYLACGDSIVI